MLQLKLRNSNLTPDKLALAEIYVMALKQFDEVVGYRLAITQFMVTYRYKISFVSLFSTALHYLF